MEEEDENHMGEEASDRIQNLASGVVAPGAVASVVAAAKPRTAGYARSDTHAGVERNIGAPVRLAGLPLVEHFPRENPQNFAPPETSYPQAPNTNTRPTSRQSEEIPTTCRHAQHQEGKPRTGRISRGVAMKGRAIKLREAHKAGSPAFCSVAWAPGGEHVVTASAADVAILVHDAAAVSAAGSGGGSRGSGSAAAAVTTIRLHKDGVTAVALAPGSSGSLASGSIDHSVKFYSFPDGTFQSNVARFTLPIRSLAFNKKGTLLAAAGDDDGIKLIATIDNTISKVLKGHKGSVTGLAFDPLNDYLASVDSFGTVMFWDLCLGSEARTLKRVAPTFGSDHSVKNALCWSPDGQTLAVPGLRNNVVMYDRDTGEEVFTLKGEHEQPVCSLCWSPNGRYLATASLDRQVLVWDLAIVTHSSDCLPSGDQVLDVKVFNISEGAQSMSGRLVLTPSSQLSWFGFSETGLLSSYDSKGVLRLFSSQFGGSWLPVFSSTKARKSEDESHWVVGLDANNIFCIICKSPESCPQVMPKPVLTILELSFPLASSDLGANSLENEFMTKKLHLSQIQKKIDEIALLGLDTTAFEDEAFNTEAALDRCILRLISTCCNGDKLVRATELVKLLTLEKSMKGALTLVTRLKLPILQEKFSSLLEERMLNDAKIAGPGGVYSNLTSTNHSPAFHAIQPAKIVQNGSSASGSKKAEVEQPKEVKDNTAKVSPAVTPLAKIPKKNDNSEGKAKRARDGSAGVNAVQQIPKAGTDQIGAKNKSSEDGNRAEPQRPLNPFAKSSSNKEQSTSLLDSIKKMKVESEKVDKANIKKVKV
uniref:Uncharacterized protein n=1 Tax=Avena sativa TaxID=4498 RepID=A0ACD5YJH1_AVESA